jgi:hypothetical protein
MLPLFCLTYHAILLCHFSSSSFLFYYLVRLLSRLWSLSGLSRDAGPRAIASRSVQSLLPRNGKCRIGQLTHRELPPLLRRDPERHRCRVVKFLLPFLGYVFFVVCYFILVLDPFKIHESHYGPPDVELQFLD